MKRFVFWLAAALLTGGQGMGMAHAQGAPGAVPPPPSDVVAAKAYSTLERYCAECHQAGASPGGAAGGIGNVLSLGEIARDPSLVRPGLPDASRLYNVALTQEQHHDAFNDPATPLPSGLEVQAIRDWISELPKPPRCEKREVPDVAALGRSIAQAIAEMPLERARLTRFVSLVHLAGECGAGADLGRLINELERGGSVAGSGAADQPVFQAVDAQRMIWRVSLRDLGWSPAEWDARSKASGLPLPPAEVSSDAAKAAVASSYVVMPSDWLAYTLEAQRGQTAQPKSLLAISWLHGGSIERLAAEQWISVATARQRLAEAPGTLQVNARRLLAGEVVGRADLDGLSAFLAGTPIPPAATVGPLRLALWADKPSYVAGDIATFNVTASKACFLTLVSVDKAGRATVLFPNEMQPDNRIAAANVVQVPAPGAAYRFRFKEPGREQVVAICSETHKAPEGIAHDFERLRFTVLGDWQLFLREPPEMKEARRDDAATDTPRPQQRRRQPRGADQRPSLSAPLADVQTRTAISIEIR